MVGHGPNLVLRPMSEPHSEDINVRVLTDASVGMHDKVADGEEAIQPEEPVRQAL
jgi:nitric oxide reductase activation protein